MKRYITDLITDFKAATLAEKAIFVGIILFYIAIALFIYSVLSYDSRNYH